MRFVYGLILFYFGDFLRSPVNRAQLLNIFLASFSSSFILFCGYKEGNIQKTTSKNIFSNDPENTSIKCV